MHPPTLAEETLIGGTGNDILFGNMGDDTLDGGDGNDALIGGARQDIVSGGAGDDLIISSTNFRDILIHEKNNQGDWELVASNDENWKNLAGSWAWNYSEGTSLFYYADTSALFIGSEWTETDPEFAFKYANGAEAEDTTVGDFLYGGNGNDAIYGSDGDDYISGDEGDDNIVGDDGNDIILGGADADHLWGDDPIYYTELSGNDFLFGGAGNDQLVGGNGNDYLEGGTENDILFGEDDTFHHPNHKEWVLSQSCNATSIRVCQPIPVALKLSTTLGESLIVMRDFVGLSCAPRVRPDSLYCKVFGNSAKDKALSASAFVHVGFSASINSSLGLRFINFYLSLISLSKTDNTHAKRRFYKHQSMHTHIEQTQSTHAYLAIGLTLVLREQRRFKLKISHGFKRQASQLNIACILGGVKANFHKTDCMYNILNNQVINETLNNKHAANDKNWRVAANDANYLIQQIRRA